MQVNLRMSVEEVFDRLALVSRQVVGDHVDFFAARLIGNNVSEEGYELCRGVARCGLAKNLTGFGIEGRVE